MKLAAAPFSVSKYVFRSATLALNFLFLACFPSRAQTPQPLLFAVSTSNNQYSASTFLRDDVAGTLTLLQTSALFKNPCVPSAIDAKGRFLFGMCAGGLSLYTYDSATGTIAEVAASPFATSTGNQSNLIVAESTGQYVYLLKINPASGPNSQSLFLDTFQIDSSTPALVPISSQTLPVLGSFVASAGDPNQHGMTIFLNQNATYAAYSTAVLYTITFDSTSGLARLDPVGGQNVGYNARSLVISPTGKYLAIGFGQATGSFSVYAIGASTFTLTSLGSYNLGPEGSSTFPDSIFFDPNGELIYVQAPPTNYSGGGLPFLIFDTATFLQLPSSPLPIADATFVAYLKDSQGPFTYASNNSNGVHGISVYLIDPGTGLASQPLPIDAPFYPQLIIDPILAPFGPSGGQGIGGPALTPSASSLTFSSTVVAQQNGPQTITLTSSGQESVSLTSIAISGANAADFLETDTCVSSPVLKAAATCAISVTYAPSSVGSSQASLFITDNAPGSPQQIALSGTAVASPPPAPAVTFNPATSLTFPGTIAQGSASLTQSITVTNSGNASLQFSAVALSGSNAGDFAISSNTCNSSLGANQTCVISIVFTPQAAGVRSTNLILTDNAPNSPQSLPINGNGAASVSISPAPGTFTTAAVSAGQAAQFNLIASAGTGFTGTLTFSCTGVPFVATCNTPASVAISNGNPAPFTISITTASASAAPPAPPLAPGPSSPSAPALPLLIALSAALALALWSARHAGRNTLIQGARCTSTVSVTLSFFLALILASGIGCGGAGGGTTPQQQTTSPDPAPKTATSIPVFQPAGGTITTGFPTVVISDATSGSAIYYTTDGTTPTANSALYSGAIPLNSPATIQAIATANGYSPSAVATASYKFQTPSGTFTITLSPTATAAGKQIQLSAIALTLTVK